MQQDCLNEFDPVNNNSEVAKKARLEKPQLNHSKRHETVLTQQDYLKCYCDENTLSLILPDMKSTSPK